MILITQTQEKYLYDPQTLAKTSTKDCILKCDYCQAVFERTMREINRGNKNISLDACQNKECRDKKSADVYKQSTSTKIEDINNKRKQTCLDKFGVDNAAKSSEKKDKIKKTNLERYGVEHALQSEQFQIARKSTMMERYGTISPLEASGRKEEIIKALQEKSINTTEKGKQTCIEKYGVDNIGLLEETKDKRKTTMLKFYGVENNSILQRTSFSLILSKCTEKGYVPLFEEKDYKTFRQLLFFKCIEHSLEFETRVENLLRDVVNCPRCKHYATSKAQMEIFDFIKSNTSDVVELSNRTALRGLELDIFLKENKLAVEYHGLYWHSEEFKDYKYHFRKFRSCLDNNIFLFQFFEDEWRDKKEICKSMIKNKMGLSEHKLFARKLQIKEIEDPKLYNSFLQDNHLMGGFKAFKTKTEKCFALVDKEENIVSCVIIKKLFSKSNKNNQSALEIVRFGTKLNTNVVGGFSRLLTYCKKMAKDQGYDKIITYSDNRYSVGNVYELNGFNMIKKTMPSYFYTDWINRFTKYRYRAKENLSEANIVAKLNLYKIYNAGNYVWELPI